MARAEPEMRAAQTQSLLVATERLPERDRAEIEARIGPRAADEARAVLPVGWLPMSLHMHVSDCVRDVVGSAGNVAVWRDTMTTTFERPLLRSFVTLTNRLFGVTPTAMLQRADRVYALITRGLGALAYHPLGAREGIVTLRGFPARRYRFVCYVEGLAGCIESTLDLCRTQGRVDVLDEDDTGNVRYAVRWE